jgi:glycosyltransferase involved in cell wall biosynthesis
MSAPEDELAGRQLLLIGINYAPEETGIAPYTKELAEHLASSGWGVTVVTGMPHYPQWRVPEEYRGSWRSREARKGVDLRRFRHYVPSQQSAPGRVLYEISFLFQAVSATGLRRPDIVVGVVPSLSGGLVAALQASRYKVPFGLVLQDLIGQAAAQSGMPGGVLAARPAQWLETWVLRRAAGVAVVADSFRPHLAGAGVAADRIVDLPNWTHLPAPTGSAGHMRAVFGWNPDQTVVLHAGNMGFKQHLENLVATARLAADAGLPLHFVLLGDGSERRRLEDLASGLPNLEFLDLQPTETFLDVLAAADILALNERPTVLDMSLPSKITSYFRAGRPLVAAVHPDGATARALTGCGGALVTPPDDPPALLAALCRLKEDEALRHELVTRGAAYASANFDRATCLARAERFVSALADSSSQGIGMDFAEVRDDSSVRPGD